MCDGNCICGQEEEIQKIISAGIPPMAAKVALIDFDGTLRPFGRLYGDEPCFEGAKEFVNRLIQDGYQIGIFTSRLSEKWLTGENQRLEDHVNYIQDTLDRDGITYHFITSEKVPSDFYIDDRAVRYEGSWKAIDDWYSNRK